MSYDYSFRSLLIIFILAFLIPLVINKIRVFRIPVVIGEIIAGIVIGKSGLNIVRTNPWIDFLSIFGFVFLMFLSGLEIDFTYLKTINFKRKREMNPLALGTILFLLTLLISFLLSVILVYINIHISPLILTLIFSSISLGIVVPVLKDVQIIGKPVGQAILLSAIIADFTTMLLLPVVMSIVADRKSFNLIYFVILIAVFIIMYFFGKKLHLLSFIRRPQAGSSQWEIRTALVLILLFVAISELIDMEIILGAFLAGILFSLFTQRPRPELLNKLDAIGYGLLIPVFFIKTGAEFDFRTVLSDGKALLLLPVLLIFAYIAKVIPALVFKKYFGWKETISAGFLLTSNLSLTLAIALTAYRERILSESFYSTFLLFAIATCIISPVLALHFLPSVNR